MTTALKNIEAAIRDLIAEEDKIAAEDQDRREERDLNAQEGMAKWAELMFYATAATVLLTLAALFAIVRTLHHTKRAADFAEGMLIEARATTKAARDTITVTREIGAKQVRPYISYSGFSFDGIKVFRDGREDFDSVGNFIFDITIRNSGQSPAKIKARSVNTYYPTQEHGWQNAGSKAPVDMVVGPNQTDKIGFIINFPEQQHVPIGAEFGILIFYESLSGEHFEDEIWLQYNGRELRQDFAFQAHGREDYRPSEDD